MKNNNLLFGTIVLTAGGLLAKIFSAIYRIALTRILGGVGIGMYQLIFPIYSLFVVLSTAGIPMAVSKVVAKNKGNKKTVLKKCMRYVLFISLVLTLFLIIFSKIFATIQHVKELYVCYLILSPTLIFIGVSSVYKGYFQGIKNFNPSAISNIIEQLVKLFLGLILSAILIKFGIFQSIIGAIIAIVVSEIVSYIILFGCFKKNKSFENEKSLDLKFKDIFNDVFPIMLTNIILPISSFVDSFLVVNLLKVNFSTEMSVYLYGLESGAVSSLINIPTIFSFSLATVLMPSICGCVGKINKNNCLNLSLKLSLIVVIPCILCFIFFPERIITVLYGNKLSDFGLNGVEIASKLMILSSFGVLGLVVNQVLSSTLQASNYKRTTIVNFSVAVCVKFVFEIIFMLFKSINIYALAISNTICYLVVTFLNYQKIKDEFVVKFRFNFVGKVMIANLVMIVSILIIQLINPGVLNIVFAFIVGAFVYLYLILKLNILNRKEKAMIKYRM